MTEEQFETGHCVKCKKVTSLFCDECNSWVCEDDCRTLKVTGGGESIHLCPACAKTAEPGKKAGGVLLDKKMLEEL